MKPLPGCERVSKKCLSIQIWLLPSGIKTNRLASSTILLISVYFRYFIIQNLTFQILCQQATTPDFGKQPGAREFFRLLSADCNSNQLFISAFWIIGDCTEAIIFSGADFDLLSNSQKNWNFFCKKSDSTPGRSNPVIRMQKRQTQNVFLKTC